MRCICDVVRVIFLAVGVHGMNKRNTYPAPSAVLQAEVLYQNGLSPDETANDLGTGFLR
jgi:hypothetical protein